MKREYILLGIVLLALGIAVVYFRGVNIAVLQPAGPVAAGELRVIIVTLLLCSIIVIPVFVLLFFFAWKYRASAPGVHVHHRPDWDHDNKEAEFFWWLVPTVIIAVLSVVAWKSSHALDPSVQLHGEGEPMTIQVVALDWKWLFIYPQQNIASVNIVEFPENTPIRFELTADAPMNSFWIPRLGGQIMVMPGMTTQLSLLASEIGMFDGFSANISGRGFSGMAFTVKSLSSGDFEQWVQSIRQASSTPLTFSAYSALAVPSEYDPVAYFSPVDPNLYTSIIMKFMMPENGIVPTHHHSP